MLQNPTLFFLFKLIKHFFYLKKIFTHSRALFFFRHKMSSWNLKVEFFVLHGTFALQMEGGFHGSKHSNEVSKAETHAALLTPVLLLLQVPLEKGEEQPYPAMLHLFPLLHPKMAPLRVSRNTPRTLMMANFMWQLGWDTVPRDLVKYHFE